MSPRKLTPKQVCFVNEYLVDLNGTQAAIRAGYSVKTARQIGSEHLTKPDIQTAIAEAMAARSQRTRITQDRVLEELAAVGFSNIHHYEIGKTGNVLLTKQAPAHANRAVASIKRKVSLTEMGESYDTELTLWNKPQALRMLGEHLGMFRAECECVDSKFLENFLQVIMEHIGAESAAGQAILRYVDACLAGGRFPSAQPRRR